MANILIADDEKDIIKLLRMYLESEEITIYEAYDGEMAYRMIQNQEIDLAIIDIMMPKLNGFELIKKVREKTDMAIIVLSARVELTDRILGLNLGADDYITKPFEPLEIAAKVKAKLRRIDASTIRKDLPLLTAGKLTLNINECVLIKEQTRIELTKVEFLVLKMFMESPGRVFTKEQIYEHGWGNEYAVDDNTIRVVISRLRDKAGEDIIKTIRGLGYRLEKYAEA